MMRGILTLGVLSLALLACPPGGGGGGGQGATLVVLGEGLAAGVGHFSLSADVQQWSFPAQIAGQLGVDFKQPLMEPPGLGNAPGTRPLPAIVPDLNQTTVLAAFPPKDADLDNLSIPGLTLADALSARPASPVVHREDPEQTAVNMILGLPALLGAGSPLPTQLEYAQGRRPEVALVELGYQEAVTAALAGDAGALPDPDAFRADYARLLDGLAETGARLVVTTVPDPLDTAYFSSVDTAAAICRTEAAFLQQQFGLAEGDLVALPGLWEIGYQLSARRIDGSLPEGAVLAAGEAAALSRGVAALNRAITELAAARGARVYDLHGFFHRLVSEGAAAGDRRLTADYLGGFYLLNGLYPGRTGHALIAADMLSALGDELPGGGQAAPLDVAAVAAADANVQARLAPGPTFTQEYLQPRTPQELPQIQIQPPPQEFPIQRIYPTAIPPFPQPLQPHKASCPETAVLPGWAACGTSDPVYKDPSFADQLPLKLPPGRQQTLPLSSAGSVFGDAIRAVDCPEDQPLIPGLPTFGLCANTFFGGLAMTDSHLQGAVTVTFSEPDADGITRFELVHPGPGLAGSPGTMAAPKLFRLPSDLNFVANVPNLVSWGELNLNTGVVTNFHYNTLFLNTAVLALFGVNPSLPPVAMTFPGLPLAGSSWAQFEQRPDGLLDLTVAGSLFLPLGVAAPDGSPTRFPLPFCNPMMQCASIVARGTALHPRIRWTTKTDLGEPCGEDCPELPENTVVEFTPAAHNSSFGDVFAVDVAELGGNATGRSHVLGRVRIQFGPRNGNTVPVAVAVLPPGGLLNGTPAPPVPPAGPPGVSRGMMGYDEVLRFPDLAYAQKGVAYSDDPFNLAVDTVDLTTGRILGEHLHRGYVQQELFNSLLDIEPCIPEDSFCYQGRASFERGAAGQTVFRFNGEVELPYPKGFNFPSPDGTQGFPNLSDGRFDPFLRLQAMAGGGGSEASFSGAQQGIVTPSGQEFSYSFEVPCDAAGAGGSFTYTEKDQGTFELTGLSWVSCTRSRGSNGPVDIVTFGGFGSWSADAGGGLYQASVQVSQAPEEPYVAIQITAAGPTVVTRVNTKPANIEDTIP